MQPVQLAREISRPLNSGWTCQVPLRSARRRIRLEPKEERIRKSPVGMADRVKSESPYFLPEGAPEVRTTPKVIQQDGQQSQAGTDPWQSPCLQLGSRTDYISAESQIQSSAAQSRPPSEAASDPPARESGEHKIGSLVRSIRPLNKVRSKELFH